MSARECHHDCQTHDYATHITTTQGSDTPVRTDRVCDACGETLQTWHANAEETTMNQYTPTTGEVEDDYAYDEWDTTPEEEEPPRREAFRRWHAAELAAAEKRGTVRVLREFADAQDSWCEAGRDEQIISRRATRDALRRRADQEEGSA